MIDSMTRRFHRSRVPTVRVPSINVHPVRGSVTAIQNTSRQSNNSKSVQSVTKHVNECPICMENIDANSNVIITHCKHQFCATCLLREMDNRNTCPVCRSILKPSHNDKYNLSNNELRDIVLRNVSFMPQDHLKIVDQILPLLNASKIPELFEENVNLMENLQEMETNILTTVSMFGYYLATDVRDHILDVD